jgi:hypothetical protein
LRRSINFDTGLRAHEKLRWEEPMKTVGSLLAFVVTACLFPAISHALTVDEIIKLKQSGVSDSTIELLIERSGDARSAGVWKQDGWIVHSTESRFPDRPIIDGYYSGYPIEVYPQFSGGRRHRLK